MMNYESVIHALETKLQEHEKTIENLIKFNFPTIFEKLPYGLQVFD
ncbi:MAG TPA: hypothetical protein VK213_00075 [Bacteroidales bacterium]|nr:hypothetical protein [Bacteroidales bacterium]